MIPLASDYLKQCGWKPKNADVHPQNTVWLDPVTKVYYTFGTANQMQHERDCIHETTKAEAGTA